MRTCSLCSKGTVVGRNRSHAQNRTPRTYMANIQKVTLTLDGQRLSGSFCTKCLKRLRMETKKSGGYKVTHRFFLKFHHYFFDFLAAFFLTTFLTAFLATFLTTFFLAGMGLSSFLQTINTIIKDD